MIIEIPLNEQQKVFLTHTTGFEPLHYLLTAKEIKEHKRKRYTRSENLFLCENEISELSDLIKANKRLKGKFEKFWENYPDLLNAKPLEAGNRFLSEVSQKDQEYFRSIQKESGTIYYRIGEILHQDTKRKERIRNSLHGILGIVQGFGNIHKFFYRSFLIPLENYRAVKDGVASGLFQKDIIDYDRRLLGYILNRTKNIRGNKIHGHNPRFSLPQIRKEFSYETDSNRLRRSLYRLGGVLCHAYGPNHSVYQINGERKAVYWDSWFIPHKRIYLAESLT